MESAAETSAINLKAGESAVRNVGDTPHLKQELLNVCSFHYGETEFGLPCRRNLQLYSIGSN